MGVITLDRDGKSLVNQDECIECSTCDRVLRRLTPGQAATTMAKCCECGAFNPARAEKLLRNMLEKGFLKAEKRR